jgi:polygalacturonase
VDGVTILNGYADGIDPDSSRYVRIANCFIDCWDDAICPKASMALGKRRSTEHLVVTNCVISTNCANFKLGTESGGDFKNISFSNSVMLKRVGNERGAVSGISLESVDGSNIDGVVVSNITMQDAGTPIFIRLGNRGRGMSPAIPGTAANISISNVIATRGAMASSVTGLNGHPVRAVTLDNINISMIGGGEAFNGLNVPEVENKYPEATMFGHLPAYALYARHVEGLTLRNIKTRWEKQDVRPAMILDDIKDLEIIGFRSETSPAFHPVAWFHNVSGALMQGSRVAEEVGQFLRITGPRSRDIMLTGNDLRRARKVIDLGSGVPPKVVRMDR